MSTTSHYKYLLNTKEVPDGIQIKRCSLYRIVLAIITTVSNEVYACKRLSDFSIPDSCKPNNQLTNQQYSEKVVLQNVELCKTSSHF